MALYNVMFLCSDCSRFHATKFPFTVIDGPDRRQQIDEVYSPRAIPVIHAVFSKRTGDQDA
jgi:hypothetical protein